MSGTQGGNVMYSKTVVYFFTGSKYLFCHYPIFILPLSNTGLIYRIGVNWFNIPKKFMYKPYFLMEISGYVLPNFLFFGKILDHLSDFSHPDTDRFINIYVTVTVTVCPCILIISQYIRK